MRASSNHSRSTLLVIAGLACGVILGLAAPATAHEVGHLIKGTSIAPHSIPGDRLENNTVTGKQVKESTLGAVPNSTKLGGVKAAGYERRVMWAFVNASGAIEQQSGGITEVFHRDGTGYFIGFPQSLAHAGLSVTIHDDEDTSDPTSAATVEICGGTSAGATNAHGEDACIRGANNTNEAFVLIPNPDQSPDAAAALNNGFYIEAIG